MALLKTFSGYSSVGKQKPNTTLTDIDLIKRDLTNHFTIRRGEKLENPDFGTIIPFLLFEPYCEEVVTAIEDDVVRIVGFDPRCRLDVVAVQQVQDGQGVRVACDITFIPFSMSDSVSWEFTKEGYVKLTS